MDDSPSSLCPCTVSEPSITFIIMRTASVGDFHFETRQRKNIPYKFSGHLSCFSVAGYRRLYLFAPKTPAFTRGFPSSASTTGKHSVFPAGILLYFTLPSAVPGTAGACPHPLGIQDRLVPFIANALSVELGTLKWKKGAWPCGRWSQEQALFVNKAPCCRAELSRGASAAFCLAPSTRPLSSSGPCGSRERAGPCWEGKLLGGGRAPPSVCPGRSPGAWSSPTLPPGRGWLPSSTYSFSLSCS